MKAGHNIMTINLELREQEALIAEYNKIRFGGKVDVFEKLPYISALMETIKSCNNNKSYSPDQPIDKFM
jgi:hypothetical protein